MQSLNLHMSRWGFQKASSSVKKELIEKGKGGLVYGC